MLSQEPCTFQLDALDNNTPLPTVSSLAVSKIAPLSGITHRHTHTYIYQHTHTYIYQRQHTHAYRNMHLRSFTSSRAVSKIAPLSGIPHTSTYTHICQHTYINANTHTNTHTHTVLCIHVIVYLVPCRVENRPALGHHGRQHICQSVRGGVSKAREICYSHL